MADAGAQRLPPPLRRPRRPSRPCSTSSPCPRHRPHTALAWPQQACPPWDGHPAPEVQRPHAP
eukprot:13886502-Alexandrium_andersonii.AAC.1